MENHIQLMIRMVDLSKQLQDDINAVNALDIEDKSTGKIYQNVLDKRKQVFKSIYDSIYLRLTRGKSHRNFSSLTGNSSDGWEDALCNEFILLNELLEIFDNDKQFDIMLKEIKI